LSEEQIPQVVENLESGGQPNEALELVAMRPRQIPASSRNRALYQVGVGFLAA
jgi:hypothetical protein